MNRLKKNILYTLTILSILPFAQAAKEAPMLELDAKNAQKQEVRHSMMGFRSTLIFYTFKDQKAVLRVLINNKDKTFPASGVIYVFDQGVTEEGLKKWLNNQHSDGLFPDVPQPTKTLKLSEKAMSVTAHKLIDHTKQHFGEFDNYAVTLEVKDDTDSLNYKLKGFKVETKVHIKTE